MIGTTAALIGAGIVAGGKVAGSVIQNKAANNAAKKQEMAADRANRLQYDMFQQQREDQAPWRDAGRTALSGLANPDFSRDFTTADFEQDPGYQFRMQEGLKALERSAAARGGLNSGGTMKALARYGQDFASNEFQNAYNRFNSDRDRRFNRLSSIAGLGQTANSQIGAAGQNYANQAGSNMIGVGNAGAAADIAKANAWGSTISDVGNLGVQGLWMNQWKKNQGGM